MADQPQCARDAGSRIAPTDQMAADGGQDLADESGPGQPALESLFVALTGVEEIVEEQQTDRGGHLTDADSAAIAAGARAVATDDGLRDTIDDVEPPDGEAHGGEP